MRPGRGACKLLMKLTFKFVHAKPEQDGSGKELGEGPVPYPVRLRTGVWRARVFLAL